MDATVTPRIRLLLTPTLAVALAMGASGGAGAGAAQGLPDPTRPPASLLRGAGGAPDAAPGVPALPQLQSILIAPHQGGRHVAVIDGQTVRLGDKFQGAVLTRVTETQVELRQGSKRQILTLYPSTPRPAAAVPIPAVAPATPSR